jgi:dihydroflavonol-4-reductase
LRNSILVTGASGLLGANICKLATAQGRHVRGMVRHQADAAPLESIEVETVLADLGDPDLLASAMKGIQGVIHAAALVGGTWATATPQEFDDVNYRGVLKILDAASRGGVERVILVSSVAIFDASATITERSQILPISAGDSPYTCSKRASYYEAMHRACRGQNLAFLVPASIYGPSPNTDRALAPTSFNGAMLKGIRGELAEFAAFPMNWVFVEDAARVALAALDEDRVGVCYLAAGRCEDERPLALLCNAAAEMVGSRNRVANKPLADISSELGPMAAMAARTYASPFVDSRETQRRCRVVPTTLSEGLGRTLEWLRQQGRL